MSTKTGIWIDHQKAVIINLDDEQERISTLESKAGKRIRLSGGSRTKNPYGTQEFAPENRRNRKYKQNLKRFYSRISNQIKQSETIYIMGPGEAKIEFKKHLEKIKAGGGSISKVESVEKMTDPQLAARVRNHFGDIKKK